ncbi:MAG TPA: glycosyltransferase family 2 protein [Polyangiaceae bacterium]|nr:glycosyltransferase family 2 protein [Polyangiaceae bacterium]
MSVPFWLAFGAGSLLLVPSSVYFVECLSAAVSKGKPLPALGRRPRLCVMVPAHNEAAGIAATVAGIRRQLVAGDRLLVIADNCSDATADHARAAGASVLERFHDTERGKGYAISYGLAHLDSDPPEVVVLVDADCTLSDGAIETLSALALSEQRPIQAEYLLTAPSAASPLSRISALALIVRNRVRPLGLHAFDLPCHLTGTGMAFPWSLLRNTPALGDNLVEDLVMGLDMALAGHPPRFCPQAKVRSVLPDSKQAATSQRTRWEHGQLATLVSRGPRLLRESVRQRRFDLAALALDLMVPPLALLVTGLGGAALTSGVAGLLVRKPLVAMLPALAGMGLVGSATVVAWSRFARDAVPFRILVMTPAYIAWKIPMYITLAVRGKQKSWVRTERETSADPATLETNQTPKHGPSSNGAAARA